MSPFIKLGIGAVLLGVGFVVSIGAQRELISRWASPCEDCEDETEKDIPSFVEEAAKEDGSEVNE